MRTELGLLKRPVLPATNTAGALQQCQTEIASLAFGRTHWARNFLCFFFPLDCCLCSPGLYIKGQDWIWFFVVVIFLHFFMDRPFNLKGGGYGILFRSEFVFRTTQELEYIFFVAQSAIFFSNF